MQMRKMCASLISNFFICCKLISVSYFTISIARHLALPTTHPYSCPHTVCLKVVFVVSGKELYAVSEFFGDVMGLGLGAEHGFYYRWPALRDESSQGVATDPGKTVNKT